MHDDERIALRQAREAADPVESAGIQFSAFVGGIAIACVIGFILGAVITNARSEDLACRPDACIDGEVVRVPRATLIHNAEVVRKMDARIVELERMVERLQNGGGCT